jgi:UDP-N-acetylglucosamine 2-epimerase (non-hydrolysing)
MLNVMTVVGTRPEIIRLSRVINEIDKYFNHTLVHTGQNYDFELNEIFFSELEIRKPNKFLNAAGKSPSQTIGNVLIELDKLFIKKCPEALVILGDTNSCISAIVAKRHKVPIFHLEAGNRCFDMRVPEEINRKIVDHISDIHLTYSQIAKDYLTREGIQPDQIITIGSPMKEVVNYYMPKIKSSTALRKLNLKKEKYFLFSFHREENVDNDDNLGNILDILNTLAEKYKQHIIVSTHPRTKKRIKDMNFSPNPLIKFMKPFGFIDYINLQMSSRCVISDSGTITEESSILNFPALNLREVHERPEGFEETSVMMVGLKKDRIIEGINILKDQSRDETRDIKIVKDYDVDNVSMKVVRIIHSYTDYINRKIWHKKN